MSVRTMRCATVAALSGSMPAAPNSSRAKRWSLSTVSFCAAIGYDSASISGLSRGQTHFLRVRLSGLAIDDREADVDDLLGRRFTVDAGEDQLGGVTADCGAVDAHGRQCRERVLRELEVAEGDEREISRHEAAARPGLLERTMREQVRAAEHGGRLGATIVELRQALAALRQRGRRGDRDEFRIGAA